jgi:CheY-like chemotaxis protein
MLGKTILVVDDNKDYREMLGEILNKMGYDVILFESGREVLRRVEGGLRYDAAIVDRAMPEIDDGDHAMQHLKDMLPGAPVISLSAYLDRNSYADYNFTKNNGLTELLNDLKILDRILG